MRRVIPFLIAILVGAFAAGIGVTIFLWKANTDRARLADIAIKAQEESKIAIETSQSTVAEANKKVEDANAEVAKAQAAIKALEEERDAFARATPLLMPDARSLAGWKEVIDVPLGVSCKVPPTSTIETNDATSLTLAKNGVRWFSITPFDERLETELLGSVVTSTSVSYTVNGHLLTGWIGRSTDHAQDVYVLRVRNEGRATHIVWARTPEGALGAQTLTSVLASLRFKN